MTRRARLEKELDMWLASQEFEAAKKMLGLVADLRYQIEHEHYLEKYGATDRPRGGGL